MGHAQRFRAAGAQKGTPLRTVADGLAVLADFVEQHFDANSSQVVGAMQHFEQGLARLGSAPTVEPVAGEDGTADNAQPTEPPVSKPHRTGQKAHSDPTE